ncbi:MAG: hypothetical protein AAF270_15840 [Pseudomonadota bacterium]
MIGRMLMLVRRELWEHKALIVAPLVVAALMIFGFVLSFITAVFTGVSFDVAVATLELTGAPASLTGGAALLGVSSGMLNLVLAAVVFFYSIDALYAERKDKSILFWRSLPVTDTETVISKLLTAVIAAPLVTIGIMIAAQIVLLILATLAILIGGGNPVELIWGPLPFVQFWVLTIYTFITSSIWFAPLIGWFLLCSAFAKRSVLLWVVLPIVVLVMLEGIVLRSLHMSAFIRDRFADAPVAGLSLPNGVVMDDNALRALVQSGDLNILQVIAPGQYLASPGLWGGLVVTALFLAGAVYCRRFRS